MKTTILRTDGNVMMDLITNQMAWFLFILCHFLVTFNLYFGLDMISFGHDGAHLNPHHYLDIPQLAAVTSLFIYFGAFCPSSRWTWPIDCLTPTSISSTPSSHAVESMWNIPEGCHMLATILPMTSVIASVIGILAIFSDYFWVDSILVEGYNTSCTGGIDQDEIWVIGLYLLNILFVGVLSNAMGLWTHPPPPPMYDPQGSNNEEETKSSTEEETKESIKEETHLSEKNKDKKKEDKCLVEEEEEDDDIDLLLAAIG